VTLASLLNLTVFRWVEGRRILPRSCDRTIEGLSTGTYIGNGRDLNTKLPSTAIFPTPADAGFSGRASGFAYEICGPAAVGYFAAAPASSNALAKPADPGGRHSTTKTEVPQQTSAGSHGAFLSKYLVGAHSFPCTTTGLPLLTVIVFYCSLYLTRVNYTTLASTATKLALREGRISRTSLPSSDFTGLERGVY